MCDVVIRELRRCLPGHGRGVRAGGSMTVPQSAAARPLAGSGIIEISSFVAVPLAGNDVGRVGCRGDPG